MTAARPRPNDVVNKPAPTRSIEASATSPMSSTRVQRRLSRESVEPRELSRNESAGSTRVPIQAGGRPARTVARNPSSDATLTARRSTPIGFSVRVAIDAGMIDSTVPVSSHASPRPAAAASTPIAAFSTIT
jgi:hypothetical protein